MAYDFKKEFKDLYVLRAKPAVIESARHDLRRRRRIRKPQQGGRRLQTCARASVCLLLHGEDVEDGQLATKRVLDYVVPPLEGLWWNGSDAFDGTGISDKGSLSWVSLIRQPDFVTPEVFERVCSLIIAKKPELAPAVKHGSLRLVRFSEGTCAQIMHKGPYDDEPATIAKLSDFVADKGLRLDIGNASGSSPQDVLGALDCDGAVPQIRLHHEVYLGDPRRTRPENLKTVIRRPVV